MKVLHLISSLKRGGMERQLCNIATSNKLRHINNHIIYFNKSDFNYIDEYNLKLSTSYISHKIFKFHYLVKIVREYDPQLIVAWSTKEAYLGCLLSFIFKIKFLNGSIRHGLFQGKLMDYLRLILARLNKNVLANSKAGLDANKIKNGLVLYNGVADNFFLKPKIKKSKINNPVIISIGHLSKIKNYPTIIKALKIISDKNINFKYLIYGRGNEYEIVTKLIQELKLNDKIVIKGNIPSMYSEIYKADILVHASFGEGCCNAILESMASGLPIIASNVGGNPEILKSSFSYLFDPNDINKLSEHIEKLLLNQTLRIKMGQNAYNYSLQNFSLDQMSDNYDKIINKIM